MQSESYEFRTVFDDNYFDEFKIIARVQGTERSVGTISLYRTKAKIDKEFSFIYETHSFVSESFRKKGIGTSLYAKAIEFCLCRGFKIGSSQCPSPSAERVWTSKKLNSKFEIKKISGRWIVTGSKDILCKC